MPTTKTEEQRLRANERARRRKKLKQAQSLIEAGYKPLEEWDTEELARGRLRDRRGGFAGKDGHFVSRQVHEEAVRRFTELAQSDMRAIVPTAIDTVRLILDNNEVDRRGRWVIPPSVKLQAAQWIVEHLVGKPTQRIEGDISVKLQGILAECLVVPDAGTRPAIDVESWVEDESETDGD